MLRAIFRQSVPHPCALAVPGFKWSSSFRAKSVLAFGDASSGVLGDGPSRLDAAPALEPEPVQGLPSDVEFLAAGAYHNLAITSAGRLWAWGRNAEGQLGTSARVLDVDEPTLPGTITRGHRALGSPCEVQGGWQADAHVVVGAAASGVASFAVDSAGRLWAWGYSKRGQLGLGTAITDTHVPQLIRALQNKRIVQVKAGWGHALALSDAGDLYAWGYNAHGRLGFQSRATLSRPPMHAPPTHADATKAAVFAADAAVNQAVQYETEALEGLVQWEPQRVLEGIRVIAISCGMDHSVALADDGSLYAFGDGHSQPTFTDKEPVLTPLPYRADDKVIAMTSGIAHTVICSAGGSVLTFGSNMDGQLGRSGEPGLPGPVSALDGLAVVDVGAGRAHSVALTDQGEVWAWGSGKGGRLGTGCNQDEAEPVFADTLEGTTILQVQCGHDYSLVLCE